MSPDEVNHPELINFFRSLSMQHMGQFLWGNSVLMRDVGIVMSSGSRLTTMPSGCI